MKLSCLKNYPLQYRPFLQNQACCVCGMSNCDQAVDHQKVQFQDIQLSIKRNMNYQKSITQIKLKVTDFYKNIKYAILNTIHNDQRQVQTFLNKFYFNKIFAEKNKNEINFISQLIERNFKDLPSRKVVKLLKKLKNKHKLQEAQTQNQEIKQKTQRLFEDFNIDLILSNLKESLPSNLFKQLQRTPKLKPKTSISQITNPEQIDQIENNKIYEWRNIRVTKNSKVVAMSNKNISDREVMEQIPILANYKSVRQFEIRNNKISCLTCHIIANNMPFLTSVDIRGNNIKDKGIIKLINGIPLMKSFFISQTDASDQSGQEIVVKLPELQMFWSQHTNISNEVALKIASKSKLKVLSLIGNPIDDEFKQKMKKIFISKGYIAI